MLSLCGQFKVSRSRPHSQPATMNPKALRGAEIVDGFIARGCAIQLKKIMEYRLGDAENSN